MNCYINCKAIFNVSKKNPEKYESTNLMKKDILIMTPNYYTITFLHHCHYSAICSFVFLKCLCDGKQHCTWQLTVKTLTLSPFINIKDNSGTFTVYILSLSYSMRYLPILFNNLLNSLAISEFVLNSLAISKF